MTLHRCYTKGHFKLCAKHGYHSIMNGCFHCIRVERALVRQKKADGIAKEPIGGLEAGEQTGTKACSKTDRKTSNHNKNKKSKK